MTKFDAYKLALAQPLRRLPRHRLVYESVAFGLALKDICAADLAHSRATS